MEFMGCKVLGEERERECWLVGDQWLWYRYDGKFCWKVFQMWLIYSLHSVLHIYSRRMKQVSVRLRRNLAASLML